MGKSSLLALLLANMRSSSRLARSGSVAGAVGRSTPLGMPSADPVSLPTVGTVISRESTSRELAVPSQPTKVKPTTPVERAHAVAPDARAPRDAAPSAAAAETAWTEVRSTRPQRATSALLSNKDAQRSLRSTSTVSLPQGACDGVVASGIRRGRVAESSSDRVARVLQDRQQLVAEIRTRHAAAVETEGEEAAWDTLSTVDRLLPLPPSRLVHHMAQLWMRPEPANSARERGHLLRSVLKAQTGVQLQLLCAMSSLPVLSSHSNHSKTMRAALFVAVRQHVESTRWSAPTLVRAEAWDQAGRGTSPFGPFTIARSEGGHNDSASGNVVPGVIPISGIVDPGVIPKSTMNVHHSSSALRSPPMLSDEADASWSFLDVPVPLVGPLPPQQQQQPAVADEVDRPALTESAPTPRESPDSSVPGAAHSEVLGLLVEAQVVEASPRREEQPPAQVSVAGRPNEGIVDDGREQLALMLHPSSSAALSEIRELSSCPAWVAGALRAIISSLAGGGRAPTAPTAKQRLALAATIALEVTDLMESWTDRTIMSQLGFSPRRLLEDLTGARVRLGSGLNSGALKVTCKKLGITAPADTEHYARIDAAYRTFLAQLWSGDAHSMQLARRFCSRLQQQVTLLMSDAEKISIQVDVYTRYPIYVPAAGDGHCLYSCISHAESTTNPAVRDSIRSALETQPSGMPDCLTNINLVDKPEQCIDIVDAETAHAAKQQSLQTRRLNNMWFAGESELLLYAKATQGAVRFRVLSSNDYNGDGWAQNPRIQVWQVEGSCPTREIVLHLCTYNSREGTGAPDVREPAHYNLLIAELADGSTCGHWPVDGVVDGDPVARAVLDLRLWQICKVAVVQNASRWATKCREEEVSSLQLAHTLQQSSVAPS